MKPLLFVKASTIVMGILILAGFGLIAYKVSEKNTSRKVKNADTTVLMTPSAVLCASDETTRAKTNDLSTGASNDPATSGLLQNISLEADEHIQTIMPCDPYICIWVSGQPRTDKLWILSAPTGNILRRIHFNKNEK